MTSVLWRSLPTVHLMPNSCSQHNALPLLLLSPDITLTLLSPSSWKVFSIAGISISNFSFESRLPQQPPLLVGTRLMLCRIVSLSLHGLSCRLSGCAALCGCLACAAADAPAEARRTPRRSPYIDIYRFLVLWLLC